MAVAWLASDDTLGPGEYIEKPNWGSVEEEIRKMDDGRFSQVMLGLDNEAKDQDHLLIGGGGENFIVSVRLQDCLYILKNTWGDKEKDVPVMAGQDLITLKTRLSPLMMP